MVLYGTEPTAAQQGVGFGVSFQWDTPLVEGYRCRILRAPRPGQSVHSERFWGLDVPEIGAALEESRPDVALIPGWHSVTLVRALWACRRARIPTLYRGDTHLGHRPTGMARRRLGCEDATTGPPVRWPPERGNARARISHAFRRRPLPSLRRAPRGRQRALRADVVALPGTGRADGGAGLLGPRAPGLRRPLRRQARADEAAAGPDPGDGRPRVAGERARRGDGRADDGLPSGGGSAGAPRGMGRLPEPVGAGACLCRGRLPGAAE